MFRPTSDLRLADLQRIVRQAAPDLEAYELAIDLARADVRQARVLPNPVLDAEYGTIPLGRTNPPDLARRFASVPSYGVGLAYTFPIGKRRHRVRQAQAIERGTRAERDAATRDHALSFAEVLGDLATATLRLDGLQQMREDAERQVAAAQRRADLSFGAPLDVDRLRLELTRTERLLLSTQSEVRHALATCARFTGSTCEGFPDSAQARAYLERWIAERGASLTDIEVRPDLRALSEYAEAARSADRLARNQRIPDPTVRLGYLHDRFVVSGNQMNSLSVAVAVPLPMFERGQAQRQAAQARVRRAQNERAKRIAIARAQVPALVDRIRTEHDRRRRIQDEALVAARDIAQTLEQAAEKRLTSVTEVVQARRALQELLLEEADAYAAAYQARLDLVRLLAEPSEGVQ